MSVTLVNYGLGNIQAFVNIYQRLNINVHIARTADQLMLAKRIILPGVGSFDWAMNCLNKSGMRACLDHVVKVNKIPIIGVCVGMQIMAQSSEEGHASGLGWFNARVKRLPVIATDRCLRLPHMGWNDVNALNKGLFVNIDNPRYYFLHSYYFAPDNSNCVLATADYHGSFPVAVGNENIFGVQFHPEKSHRWGIQLLKNFAEI